VAGGKNMTLVTNSALSVDRFDAANSALAMTTGYATVPTGVYFDPGTGGFTVMLWVKMLAFPPSGQSTKFVDLGIGSTLDNVRLGIPATSQPKLSVYKGYTVYHTTSANLLQLNQWAHIAAAVNGSNSYIYINGILVAQGTGMIFLLVIEIVFLKGCFIVLLKGVVYNAVQRNLNYIGKGSYSTDIPMNGVIDELKIFSRGLNQEEIVNEMNVIRLLLN